ncbi:MAG: hypothetical protein M1835_007218 [Candelina submexicana]|nr:MAG: hypothetical protein M1835_007218 [Candelina submexicana]
MTGSTSLKRRLSISPPPVKRTVQSTTTTSRKEPEKITWRTVNNSLLIAHYRKDDDDGKLSSPLKKRRIAAFDFDSTLIRSASGNKFAKDGTDWTWWDASVPGKLHNVHAEGYQVVILSNQGGISLKSDPKSVKHDQKRLAEFKLKVTSVFKQLDLPISLYAATARDKYRKPRTGMWEEMLEDYGLQVADSVELDNCIFVGDAAGRISGNGVKEDFSCSDRNFSVNLNIPFCTPEEFFLGGSPKAFVRKFDPTTYSSKDGSLSGETGSVAFIRNTPLDVVLFCGSPGAGKSTFYWTFMQPLGYERVNQDLLKTRDKCLQLAAKYISEGRPVAIDNTNADPDTRAKWVQLANKCGVPIRCIYFTASTSLCEHNDTVRALNGNLVNPEQRTLLPAVAFSSFVARFQKPTLKEGFEDITEIDFKVSNPVLLYLELCASEPGQG